MKRTLTYERLADEFVSRLEASSRDRFVMKELLHCRECELSNRPNVHPIFYQLLPAEFHGQERIEKACFLVATNFPVSPRRASASFGVSLREFAKWCDGGERYAKAVLNALRKSSLDSISYYLAHTLAWMGIYHVPIDWRQLLVDLLRWEEAGRPVQRQWARDFAGGMGQSD